MSIITLSSDFGLQDYHVGVLKGTILSRTPSVSIVDISHNIKTYDIVQAAYVVKQMYSSFPENTIHIISVNNYYGPEHEFIVVREDGHYFIGPDNGVFSLIFEDETLAEAYSLDYNAAEAFPLKNIYADAIAYILSEKPFEEIGKKRASLSKRISLQAVTTRSQIRGNIIHIDNFENVIINVNRNLFERIAENRPFKLFFKRHDPICALSLNYFDVPVGDVLCHFNSANFLEIAINMGKAASLLGLKVEDSIQIDFEA